MITSILSQENPWVTVETSSGVYKVHVGDLTTYCPRSVKELLRGPAFEEVMLKEGQLVWPSLRLAFDEDVVVERGILVQALRRVTAAGISLDEFKKKFRILWLDYLDALDQTMDFFSAPIVANIFFENAKRDLEKYLRDIQDIDDLFIERVVELMRQVDTQVQSAEVKASALAEMTKQKDRYSDFLTRVREEVQSRIDQFDRAEIPRGSLLINQLNYWSGLSIEAAWANIERIYQSRS